ncbi:cadherin domain protein [Ancylostoma ceylanicum]|uniref:Cadherin domain protein n=1 Tax=Ancylostoma ceylanicum TaxID=53326 RepID=A0A0D6LFY8_9BILA|nr:cadherin domain protein [Ancylostoma ceylanicum]
MSLDFQLKALSLISGKEHEVPIEVKTAAEEASEDVQEVPAFEKENFDLSLEHHFDETEIAIVKLKADPPAGTRFSLIGPLSDRFSVKNEGQLIYVTAIPCEDGCSTPPVFTLLLTATNEKSQQSTTLTFTAKEEQEFKFLHTPYSAVLEEEVGVFEKAVKVMTTGATGDVMYSVQDITGLFSIHPKSGVLMVQHPEFLTVNGYGSQLNLTAVATDAKKSIRATIPVTLTRAAEGLKGFKFVNESYSFTVSPGQTMVGLVEIADAGNHTVHYDIAEGGQGVITIDDQGMLFYQREPEKDSRNFTTLVSARTTEGQFLVATAWVDIAVMGINSYPVKLVGPARRTDVLSASTKRGAKVASIELTDADDDAAIQLSIESISGMYLNGSRASELSAEMFKVQMNGKTADLVLKERIFDLPLVSLTIELRAQDHAHAAEPSVSGTITTTRSLKDLIEELLTVTASDPSGEQSAQANFTVVVTPSRVSRTAFMERQYQAEVRKSDPLGTTVLVVTAQTDRGEEVKSYDVEGIDADFFSIDSKGVIRLKDSITNVLRYELNFVAKAGEGLASSSVPVRVVIIAEDDEEIAFEKNTYEIKVMENLPLNGYVLHPQLVNPGHGHVEYSINTQNDATILADLLDIDENGRITIKEELLGYVGTYEFQVRAVKGERLASADVIMHVLPAYRCVPSFTGDGNLEFVIDELVLGLQAGTHQFAQLASTIRVVDVDDHPLEAVLDALTVEVPEDAPLGTIVATMRAVDRDRSQTVFYRLRDESKEFSVNSTTGEVIVAYGLDRETKDFYRNDNGPLFEQSRYHLLVGKNALPGEPVLTVSASDPDQPVPGNDMKDVFYKMKEMLFDYHGMNRAVENMFSVGQRSGVIRLEQSVSDFVGGVFHLLLESMDSLEPDAHKDQCIVKVYVHDDSDIVRMELPMPPAAVTYEKISNVKGTISNATGLKAMVKDLRYHHEEGNLVYDVTDLRLVLVNRTTSEIIPAERAIAIADKHRSAMGDRIPSMTKAQVRRYDKNSSFCEVTNTHIPY